MVLGATSLLGQLEASLNQIWGVAPRRGRPIYAVVLRRLTHLGLIFGMGLLLLVSLAVSTALAAIGGTLHDRAPVLALVLPPFHLAVSIGISAAMFACLFKWLPAARIAWRDVWLGGLVTAVLFAVGRGLIATYLGRATAHSVYGAAGSVVMLLLWIYYSAQILLIGAEFTEVYSRRVGSRRSRAAGPLVP
jgi:membrane protein